MRALALISTVFMSWPMMADTAMNAEAFERYTTGKTLYFGSAGAPYGAEQYLSGRRVIWTFLDGQCQYGIWYESEGQICFVYEERPASPQCWVFARVPGGLKAQFEGDPQQTELIEVEQDSAPLKCPGPAIGV